MELGVRGAELLVINDRWEIRAVNEMQKAILIAELV